MKYLISSMMIVFLLASCAGQPGTLTGSPTLASISPTISHTPTIKPTSTIVPVTLTPSFTDTPTFVPSSTPTPTSKPGIFQRCLTIQPDAPLEENVDGTIIISDFLPPSSINISLFNLSTHKIRTIPVTGGNVRTSPNGSYFAFVDFNHNNLEIFSAQGRRIKSIPVEENRGVIERWLDNEHLVFIKSEPYVDGSRQRKYPPAIMIFNPFDGRKMLMPPDYPDIDTTHPRSPWSPYSVTVYSQDMERVVYLGAVRDELTGQKKGSGYILYSIPDHQRMAQIEAIGSHHPPIWSPDGSKFIFMGDDEFYLVSYEGNASKITHLNPDIKADTPFKDRYSVQYSSWSPDNRHLAFWLIHPGTQPRTFAILDTITGEVIDYCIKAGFNYQQYVDDPFPVWSPDGKRVIITANFYPEDQLGSSLLGEGNEVVLINLDEKLAYKISENKYVLGWLVPPQ